MSPRTGPDPPTCGLIDGGGEPPRPPVLAEFPAQHRPEATQLVTPTPAAGPAVKSEPSTWNSSPGPVSIAIVTSTWPLGSNPAPCAGCGATRLPRGAHDPGDPADD